MPRQFVAAALLGAACILAVAIPSVARWRYRPTRHLPHAKRVWILFTIGGEFFVGEALMMGIPLISLSFPSLLHLAPYTVDILVWLSAGSGAIGTIAMLALMWRLAATAMNRASE